MALRRDFGMALLVGASMVCTALACGAQSTPAAPAANPAPCSVAPQPEPCGTPAPSGKPPSAAEQFPFPGEGDGSGPSPTAPNLSGLPQAPNSPAAAPGATSATPPAGKKGADFPFPDYGGKSAASDSSDAGSSSSSSSSNDDAAPPDPDASSAGSPSAGSPDAAGLKDKGSEGTSGRRLLHRVNPPGTKLQSPDEREKEDLSVAHFYTQTGDLQGAYLRSQDAVKTAPDDSDAHFALAEIALKMKKWDEAIAEYKACLKLDPTEKESSKAHKELNRLKP